MNWMEDAACATADPELWFPDANGWASAEMAKAICGVCPVAAECLRYALDNDIPDGLREAIPPAYAEFVGRQLLAEVRPHWKVLGTAEEFSSSTVAEASRRHD